MQRADFSSLVKRIVPWLVRAEGLLRPRLAGFAATVAATSLISGVVFAMGKALVYLFAQVL